jgi:hypothetical protein
MDLATLESTAAEFIAAYYQNVTYSPEDVAKFYDPESAIIWRKSLNSKVGVKFSEAGGILVPTIEKGSSVSILDYHLVQIDQGFVLNVIGKIAHETNTECFNQTFTIYRREDRVFIVGDSLRFANLGREQDLELVYVPPRKRKGGQNRKPATEPVAAQEQPPAPAPPPAAAPAPAPAEVKESGPPRQQQSKSEKRRWRGGRGKNHEASSYRPEQETKH